MTLRFLEEHIVLVPLEPRRPGCSVVEGKDITKSKVKALADAAERCWNAIISKNLEDFARSYADSFNAQVAMFPAMVNPVIKGNACPEASVQPYIDEYSSMDDVLALKLAGAGGGGYLALVVKDSGVFCKVHQEAIPISIRRAGK